MFFASLVAVKNGDGSSNTLLLAHKFTWPRDYGNPNMAASPEQGSQDVGWAYPSGVIATGPWATGFPFTFVPGIDLGNYDHFRNPSVGFYQDDNNVSWPKWKIGSPHLGVMPCLFADGSVRSLSLGIPAATVAALWHWNDGQVVSLP